MTTKTSKAIFSTTFALFAFVMLMYVPQTLLADSFSDDALSVSEKNSIAPSIKSFEVSNLKIADSLTKVIGNEFSIDYKGKTYDLILFEDNLLNNAVTDDNTDNAVAYVGYVKGDTLSEASIIISDKAIAGTIRTGDTVLTIEPLSFYGHEFTGERQIVYDQTDLDFEFSFDDSDMLKKDTMSSTITNTSPEFTSFLPIVTADPGHLIDTIIVTDDDYDNLPGSCATALLTRVGSVNTIYTQTEATINLLSYDCTVSYLNDNDLVGYADDLRIEWDGDTTTSRDAVLAFIGDDGDGGGTGAAWRDSVTNTDYMYGAIQLVDDSSSGYDASAFEQSINVAHEMGHIMSCWHDNNTFPSGDFSIMAGNVAITDDTFDDEFLQTCEDDINDTADDHL